MARADIGNVAMLTDNALDIPVLDLRLQATQVDLPVERWGRRARTKRFEGTYHFYTDDYRFQAIWKDPSKLLQTGCVAAVEPNWSVHEQTPLALAIYATYRKRWLARTWQDRGVRILVDLNVASRHQAVNLAGVPRGWSAFATRGANDRLDETMAEYHLACDVAGCNDVTFLVVGGGQAVQEACREMPWLWIPEEADAARSERWAKVQEADAARQLPAEGEVVTPLDSSEACPAWANSAVPQPLPE